MRKVLYSPGFGAGWSTWADDDLRDLFLFDEALIDAVEAGIDLGDKDDPDTPLGDFAARLKAHGGYGYLGGARDLRVARVDGQFYVDEYDGSESIVRRDDGELWI